MVEVVPPRGGEVVGDAPDRRVEILADGPALHATWSRFGPRRSGADLHVHRRHTDLFYVLDGELVVLLGPQGEEEAVPAGTLVRLPPLVVHGFRAGEAGTSYLNLHAPGRGFAGFLRALRDGRPCAYDQEPPPPGGGRPPGDAVIGRRELVTDEPGLRVVLLTDSTEIWLAEAWAAAGSPAVPVGAPSGGGEALYVLGGELALTARGAERRAAAGFWVRVAPGAGCAVAPAGGGPARFLRIRAPGDAGR